MRTLATRGVVSLHPEVGETAGWQPTIFEIQLPSSQLSVVSVYHRVVLAAPETSDLSRS